jgi:hypothetical protein
MGANGLVRYGYMVGLSEYPNVRFTYVGADTCNAQRAYYWCDHGKHDDVPAYHWSDVRDPITPACPACGSMMTYLGDYGSRV